LTPTTRYNKFSGVEILYRGFNLRGIPLKYSPGGRPWEWGTLGMADHVDGGPWEWGPIPKLFPHDVIFTHFVS